MSINVVDIVIILLILLGGVIGFKQGAIRTLVDFVGICLIVIVAFVLKDKLMVLFYENFPFFDFFGLIKGITAANILLYQLLAFVVIFLALYFVLKVLLVVTGFIEWVLKMTIFLSLPSKIIGFFVGALQYYIYVFLVLFLLNAPVWNFTMLKESSVNNFILNDTPLISKYANDTVKTYSEVYKIIKNRDNKSKAYVNTEFLMVLLENKLISVESAKKLVNANKIEVVDKAILDNYEESEIYNYLDSEIFEKIGG